MNKLIKSLLAVCLIVVLSLSTAIITLAFDDHDPGGGCSLKRILLKEDAPYGGCCISLKIIP